MIEVDLSCRFLSHSELAPLRVPLVPMEHCTSRFFQECDADKDKQVSFKEWTSCFGIKNGESSSTTFSFSTDLYSLFLHFPFLTPVSVVINEHMNNSFNKHTSLIALNFYKQETVAF